MSSEYIIYNFREEIQGNGNRSELTLF